MSITTYCTVLLLITAQCFAAPHKAPNSCGYGVNSESISIVKESIYIVVMQYG